jgi:acyl transferase domain-containing protein/protein-L-isoaspartate O-methyltransferase
VVSDFLSRISKLTAKQLMLLADELNTRVEMLGKEAAQPLAVIGLGCRFPGGADSPDRFWEMLINGRDGLREVPPDRWDLERYFDEDPDKPGKMNTRWGGFLESIDQFDADFFGISPREAVRMDPQQRLLLEVTWETIEHAGVSPRGLNGSQTGVFVGICNSDYFQLLVRQGPMSVDAYLATGSAHSIASGRISYILGLEGPSLSVDTACSSSLVGVHLACQSLRLGECRFALAGGVNLMLSPEVTIALSKSHMIASDGKCKTFDRAANGFVRGEGCGMVALKRLSDAQADGDNIIALILGSAANQDGRSSGITAPNGPSQAAVIRKALRKGGLEPSAVGYIEAHGTGTALGDPIEIGALAEVFGAGRDSSSPLLVGSVKTNIGHAESAAGIAGLIKLILSVNKGEVPPHLHFHEPNPQIQWSRLALRIPVVHEPWPKSNGSRIGGVSSFGFSGTNAHIIVGQAPLPAMTSSREDKKLHLIVLSARDTDALRQLAGRHADYLERFPETHLGGFCRTLMTGRKHHPQRAAFAARSLSEIRERLTDIRHGTANSGIRQGKKALKEGLHPVFLFTGQGAQYPGMGLELYETQPVFRRTLDQCDALLQSIIGKRLKEVLDPRSDSNILLDQTAYTQPALFAVEYALAAMWRDWGIEPGAVMGHSVGEYVAACIAGVFSLEDGLRLIARRGQLMQGLPETGGMAAVSAPAEKVGLFLEDTGGAVTIAALNGPYQTVISGERKPLERVLQDMDRHGPLYQRLQVSHAFHSRLMDPILDTLAAEASQIRFGAPRLPIVSNITGSFADSDYMCHAEYWRLHTRQTVQFAPGLLTLFAAGHRHFLEIGPHPVLCALGKQCLPDSTIEWYCAMRKGKSDQEEALRCLGALYVNGADVQWERVENPDSGPKIPLPTYPFQRKRYWCETTSQPQTAPATPQTPAAEPELDVDRLLGSPILSPALADRVFESRLALNRLTYLNHHRIFDLWIMPTPAYMEMAMAVSDQLDLCASTNGWGWEINNLQIEEALILPEEEPIRVQTIVTPSGPDVAECRFYSGSPSAQGIEWHRHAVCRIRKPIAKSPACQGTELNEAQSRCTAEVPVDAFYRKLQDLGLVFGSAFRGIRRIWQGEHEALGEMSLPDELACDEKAYRFHPALLDACFHLLGASLGAEMHNQAYLLIGIDNFRLYRKPPSRFWNLTRMHRLNSSHRESINGDIILFDGEGRVIAEIKNLLLKRADRKALMASIRKGAADQLLYSVKWHDQPLPAAEQSVGIEEPYHPREQAEQLTERLRQHAGTFGLEVYGSLLPHLDRFCTAAIIRTFQEGGVNFQPGAVVTRSDIEQQLRLNPRHARLMGRLLDILMEDGILVPEDDRFRVTKSDGAPGESLSVDELVRRHPPCEPEILLTDRCAGRLLDVLRGDCDPLSLLFPGGQIESLEKIYKESPYARSFNSTLSDALEHEIGVRCNTSGMMRILEIGAGTGGTTAHLLPLLAGKNFQYIFTDISPLLIDRARENFKAYPSVGFETLDIENDADGQGFAGRRFDIVIAANVLHATKRLKETIDHVRQLMAPGGLLLLLEGTAPQRWVDLTFGLTDGWWRYEDTDLRPKYPLIDRRQWKLLLEEAGLSSDTVALEDPAAADGNLPHVLVLARKPRKASTANQDGRCWVLFRDENGIADALAAKIEAAGGDIILVNRADHYLELSQNLARIRPSIAEDFKKVLGSALKRKNRRSLGVIYFWNFHGRYPAHSPSGDFLTSLMYLMQAVIAIPGNSLNTKLWVCTQGAQPVSASDTVVEPLQASCWGLTRVFGLEHPNLLGGLVDLDPESAAAASADRLWSQLMVDDDEDQTAVRGGHRYVPRIERVENTVTPDHSVPFRKDATYLITGGLGGLGLKIAAWMSSCGAGRLILLSRKKLPPRSEWKDLPVDHPEIFWIRSVQDIESAGAAVEPVSMDVSDREAMSDLFRKLKKDAFSPLRGIIHAAVHMSAHPLEKLTPETLAEMMRPKVEGALLLDELSREIELDFFTMFSSTTSLWGVAGLAHYAAANQVIDALAHRRRKEGLPALSINWGTWEEMRIAGAEEKRLFRQAGLTPIPVELAVQTLERLLHWKEPQICVASVDWRRLRGVYEARTKRPFFERMSAPAAPNGCEKPGTALFLREELGSAPKSRWQEILVGHLKKRVQQVLHLENAAVANTDRGLFEMGMDSLMAVELITRR